MKAEGFCPLKHIEFDVDTGSVDLYLRSNFKRANGADQTVMNVLMCFEGVEGLYFSAIMVKSGVHLYFESRWV